MNSTEPTRPGGLPPAPAKLIGRTSETGQLLKVLTPSPSADAGVVAIAGLAGVGKTALALHGAHEALAKGWFPGGHLYVDLNGYSPAGPTSPDSALITMLRALCGPEAALPTGVEELSSLYRSWLDHLASTLGPTLLVLDNAASSAQVLPLLPGNAVHRVVVTSRHTLAGLAGARHLDLDALTPAAATHMIVTLLAQARPDDSRFAEDPDAGSRLAQRCGHLPLALHIAAAILKVDVTLSVDDLAAELEGTTACLDMSVSDGEQTLALLPAFDASYQRLDGADAELFRWLAYNPTAEFSLEAAAALLDVGIPAARRRISRLAQAHLVAPVGRARWRMHDLVYSYSCRLLSDESEQPPFERLMHHYVRLAREADTHLTARPSTVAFSDREAAMAWFDVEHSNLMSAARRGIPELTLLIADELRRYLDLRSRQHDALALAGAAVQAAQSLGEKSAESSALEHVAIALFRLHRHEEAVDFYEKAAQICRDIGDVRGEGRILSNCGLALRALRRHEAAREAHSRELEICREHGDQGGEACALNNHGIVLREQGRPAEALAEHRRSLSLHRKAGDLRGEAHALGNIGKDLRELHRPGNAVVFHRHAIDLYRLAGDLWGEANAHNNLGVTLSAAGENEQAVSVYQQALSLFADTGETLGRAWVLHNLSQSLQELQQAERAVATATEALRFACEADDKREQAKILNTLGIAQSTAGRPEQAVASFGRSLEISGSIDDFRSQVGAAHNLRAALLQCAQDEERND